MMFDTFGDMSSTLTYRPGVPPLRDRSEPTAEQIEKWSPDKMIEDLLSVRGKAMTKPVPVQEMDLKCALSRAKAIFVRRGERDSAKRTGFRTIVRCF